MRARSTSLIAHKTYWSIRFRYFILKIILIHNTWIWFLFVACKDDRDCSWIVKNIGEGDPLKKYCNRWKQKKAIQECRETCKLCELKWCKFFFQTQLDVVSLRRQARSERGAPDTPPSRLSRAPRLAVSLLLSLSWKTRKNKACFAGYLLLQLTMSSGGAHLWRGKYLPHSQRWIGNSSNSYFILSSQIILHFLLGKPAISFSTTFPSGRSWTKATIGHPKKQ